MKKSGMSRRAWLAIGGNIIQGGGSPSRETVTGQWYVILKRGGASSLPANIPLNVPFKAPSSGAQFALAAGDEVLELAFERFCKTTADWSMEQGSIDVGDDCDPGAQMRDGITTISGSLNGFFRFDESTEQMVDVSQQIFNLFVPFIEDTGTGGYVYHDAENPTVYLALCLNGDAAVGNIENWFITPINISSVNASGSNTDAQTMEISWTKGEGLPVSYNVPRAA